MRSEGWALGGMHGQVTPRTRFKFSFRYVLHSWTAKYSHWTVALGHSVLSERVCDSGAKWNISHLEH
jgi:hypothetical protein